MFLNEGSSSGRSSSWPVVLLLFVLATPLILAGAESANAQSTSLPPLDISEDGRHLVRSDGTPFFWLGDTAWELFHRLDREEATRYLRDRADKGFTVIQAVVLAQLGGLETPNPYGHMPLQENDPTQPNEAYFEHVDFIVDKAEELGLYVALLPTWGTYWKERSETKIFTERNARSFGQFLGNRYRDEPIIWVLGGDANIGSNEERAIINAMAEGLQAGDGGRHLMTYHPRGPGLSSEQLHTAPWLDFNMIQSSHGAHDHSNGRFVENDYALTPTKPTLDAEPRYERVPVGFYFENADPFDRFDAYDVRQAAYWALLAGAAGHTYGNNNVWQMWSPEHRPVLSASTPWSAALDHPGAFQMTYVRRLFTSRPFQKLAPDPELVVDGPEWSGAAVRGARAKDGSFAFVYSPRGAPFTVDTRRIEASQVKMIWYNPRYGTAHPLHTTSTRGFQTFTPPSSGRGHDWILILEDNAASFPLPGPPSVHE